MVVLQPAFTYTFLESIHLDTFTFYDLLFLQINLKKINTAILYEVGTLRGPPITTNQSNSNCAFSILD